MLWPDMVGVLYRLWTDSYQLPPTPGRQFIEQAVLQASDWQAGKPAAPTDSWRQVGADIWTTT